MLTSAEKKKLRGVAQRLPVNLQVGKAGLTNTVLSELEVLLKRDQLVKLKFVGDRETVDSLVSQIQEQSGAECVGSVGKTAAFFRAKAAQ